MCYPRSVTLQAACQELVGVLGHEPAYLAVSLAPDLLVRQLRPGEAAAAFSALHSQLKMESTAATALLVQAQPRALGLKPDALNAQLSGLSIALGSVWPDKQLLIGWGMSWRRRMVHHHHQLQQQQRDHHRCMLKV
jgi:hypothetical protein